MPGTYSQIFIQVVFAVKGRQNLLQKPWREEVFKYISGIITAKGHKAIIVNGVSDHVHVFIGLKPVMALSDLVRDIKNNSSKSINEQPWLNQKFQWQEGYGAFSYSKDAVSNVYNYILNQEAQHSKKTFRQEYLEFLTEYEIAFNEQFLFEWIDENPGDHITPSGL